MGADGTLEIVGAVGDVGADTGEDTGEDTGLAGELQV